MILVALLLSLIPPAIPEVSLADLEQRFARGGDTVFVVNFWATWCRPCVEELPAFDRLARAQSGAPVVVILVSLDPLSKNIPTVAPFLRKQGYACDAVILTETKAHFWIDKVDPAWSGAIPATLFVAKGRRLFQEQGFSYSTLDSAFTTFRDHNN